MTAKKGSSRGSGKRELIAPRGDKRYAKRDAEGRFTEMDDVGRSLSADRRRSAKKKVKAGYGDQGDQSRSKSAKMKSSPTKSSAKKR